MMALCEKNPGAAARIPGVELTSCGPEGSRRLGGAVCRCVVDREAIEDRGKMPDENVLHRRMVDGPAKLAGQRGHLFVGDPARHDQIEVVEVGR